MLERLALRCQPVVVRCNPPLDVIKANFEARKGEEYLKDVDQLVQVAEAYDRMSTAIPMVDYDYTVNGAWHGLELDLATAREFTGLHLTTMWSAGNLRAKILLVGESFAERKNQDPFFQWPFASFSDQGCSRWLTRQLIGAGIDEARLLWVNADQFTHPGHDYWIYAGTDFVVALGAKASAKLSELGVRHTSFVHPQAWKRFHATEVYPLIQYLEELKEAGHV
jgi:hypothetical protein